MKFSELGNYLINKEIISFEILFITTERKVPKASTRKYMRKLL